MSFIDPFNIQDQVFPDPSRNAGKTLDRIPKEANQYGKPFYDVGVSQIPGLNTTFQDLINNPQKIMDMLGKGYKQSPGYANRLGAGEQGITNAAAAGGMLGTGEHQTNAGKFAENFASDDYNSYMKQITDLFNTGLSGSQDLMHQGQKSGSEMADRIQKYLTDHATLEYTGQQSKNDNMAKIIGMIGSMFGGKGGM